jgi:hypothetical protein
MSCDCNTLVVGEAGAPGPQGLAGINGTNGTNGLNAFTTTSANFTQPASLGAAVTFSVVQNQWMAIGQTVYISDAGFYTVASLGGSPFSSVTANLIGTDGVAVGQPVSSGRKVSPSASAVYSDPLVELTVLTGGTSDLDGPVTINTSESSTADVRIAGFGDSHLLFCDANAGTTGRVGISTNQPDTTLHVDGTFKVGDTGSPADAEFTRGAVFNSLQSGTGADGDFLIKTQGSAVTFFVDANENRVGIGTNAPSKLLDVNGAAEMNTLLVNPGGVQANPSFQVYGTNSTRPITVLSTDAPFNGVGIFKTTPTVALDVVGATTITGATILGSTLAVTGNVTVGPDVLKVNATGPFVGINKATPTVALDVVGAATVTGATILGSTLNATGATSLNSTLDVDDATTLNSTLYVDGDLTVNSSVLYVTTSTNRVGVNQSSPLAALDVSGSAIVSTDLTVSDALYVVGSSNFVGINKSSPNFQLDVDGSTNISGNLSVDTNVLKVEVSTNRVGVNKTTPTVALDVVGAISRGSPVTKDADFSILSTENWIIVDNNGGPTTITFPAASSTPGREIFIKTIRAQAVESASQNIVPLDGTSHDFFILSGVAGKWATLVSDGNYWVIMAGN